MVILFHMDLGYSNSAQCHDRGNIISVFLYPVNKINNIKPYYYFSCNTILIIRGLFLRNDNFQAE